MNPTKAQIIALAEQLIRTRGYNAFSYKDISDVLHIKNAAVHYHFPTKTDLGVEVLTAALERLHEQKEAWKNLPEDEQIHNFIEVFCRQPGRGLICIMGSMSPDYDTLPPPVQEQLNKVAAELLEWVAERLESGRMNKLFHFEGDPYDRALLVTTNLQASLLMSRVLGNEVFTRMRAQLIHDLIDNKSTNPRINK